MSGYTYRFDFRTSGFSGGAGITWAVQRLILLNAGLFALQLVLMIPEIAGVTLRDYAEGWLSFRPALFIRGCVWQPLTYMFLHSGLMHLFLNMLWLYFFGPEVERVLSTRQFVRFYLFCGAVGVLTTLIPFWMRSSDPSVIGASGATMGVLMAFAVIDPNRTFFLFPLPVPITARWLVIIVVFLNLISAQQGDSISVMTHLGGLAAGYLYMKAVPRWRQWREKKAKPRDPVGEAVDNIFKFDERRRDKR